MKQMEVTIMGQSYVLACPPDGEDALLAAVRRVDEEMAAIRDSGKVKARERIAVLAALNLAYAKAEAGPHGEATAPVASGNAPTASDGTQDAATSPATDSPPRPGGETDPELSAGIEALIRRIDERLGDGAQAA